MPTYEYECSACGYIYEVFQKISDKPLIHCPKCNKNKLKRLIRGGAGIIFKGSGFYATDYRRSSPGQKPKANELPCPKAKEGCTACQLNEK